MFSNVSQKEPVALGALVGVILNAVLLALSAFGILSLSDMQTAAVYGLANAICFVVVAVKTRQVVFSPYTIAGDPGLPALPGTEPGPTPQGGPQSIEDL